MKMIMIVADFVIVLSRQGYTEVGPITLSSVMAATINPSCCWNQYVVTIGAQLSYAWEISLVPGPN